jgi:hypothetical protein
MFSTWSGTTRRKRAFSYRSAFSSFTSLSSSAPYYCFQRYSVASLRFTLRQTASDVSPRSSRRRI